ncbi:hypothetical protein SAMN04515671_0079 [Nakamurella panacisegetis]|uniref:Uncharacterized protein n=1 Tax=Nakamurella panacisegetis TaxID=1090615 RepID=A0A1H0HHT5_9ACTN|nr:hypothetical protein [Nakamurella panacisegetis]SDO18755.1 hypothetical protein SAMN04515671_0079 [Nakamurella panacisegetis]
MITDQVATLVDAETSKKRPRDFLGLFGLPVVVFVVILVTHVQLKGIGQLLGGVSVLTGLLFGLVVWVFQLRMTVGADPRVPAHSTLPTLIDELFANVLYSVLAGVGSTAVIVASATASDALLNKWWSAGVLAVITHFVLAMAICLKRVRSAYHQMIR